MALSIQYLPWLLAGRRCQDRLFHLEDLCLLWPRSHHSSLAPPGFLYLLLDQCSLADPGFLYLPLDQYDPYSHLLLALGLLSTQCVRYGPVLLAILRVLVVQCHLEDQ